MKLVKWILFFNFFLFLALPQAFSADSSSLRSFGFSSQKLQNTACFNSTPRNPKDVFDINIESEIEEQEPEDGPSTEVIFSLIFRPALSNELFNYTDFHAFFLNSFLSYYSLLTTSPPIAA